MRVQCAYNMHNIPKRRIRTRRKNCALHLCVLKNVIGVGYILQG